MVQVAADLAPTSLPSSYADELSHQVTVLRLTVLSSVMRVTWPRALRFFVLPCRAFPALLQLSTPSPWDKDSKRCWELITCPGAPTSSLIPLGRYLTNNDAPLHQLVSPCLPALAFQARLIRPSRPGRPLLIPHPLSLRRVLATCL